MKSAHKRVHADVDPFLENLMMPGKCERRNPEKTKKKKKEECNPQGNLKAQTSAPRKQLFRVWRKLNHLYLSVHDVCTCGNGRSEKIHPDNFNNFDPAVEKMGEFHSLLKSKRLTRTKTVLPLRVTFYLGKKVLGVCATYIIVLMAQDETALSSYNHPWNTVRLPPNDPPNLDFN